MMKYLALLLCLGIAMAHEGEQPADGTDPYADLSPLEAAIERMLSERASPEAMDKAIAEARKQGVSKQAILEARFLFHVDRREDGQLAAMVPEFLERKKSFKISDSEIFAIEEDWLAVVEYVQAIAALRQDDHARFKSHITEAFWLSPKQAAAFAPHIDRLRLEEKMRSVKLDFTLPLTTLTGEKTNLATIAAGDKAVLLHFWSPWSRECEASMPDFNITAAELADHGIAVVTILGESGPDVIADTLRILKDEPSPASATWLNDHPDQPLNHELHVQSVPVMVLVGLDGKVIYHGHPSEDGLWQALARIAPEVERPPVAAGR